jgi:SET domain-containing protein
VVEVRDGRSRALVAVGSSAIQGSGVFSVGALSPGAIILQIDDSHVIDIDHRLRQKQGESARHLDYLPDGTVVLMQSPECFINHSCDPNVYVYSVERRRFVLAKRAVASGEEIVFDYALNAVEGDVWQCCCGAVDCRGLHKCDFFTLPVGLQRESLPYLDPWFAAVHTSRILTLLRNGLEQG